MAPAGRFVTHIKIARNMSATLEQTNRRVALRANVYEPHSASELSPGIPLDIDARAYRSVGALFETSAAKFGPRAAFVNMGTAISYAEMERLTRCFAAYLHGVLKLPKGARVALMMPNILQYPIAMLGALRAGCAVVNCNPLYTPRELKRQLQDSGAEVVVVMENFASVVEQVLAETSVKRVVVTGLGDMLDLPKGLVVNFVVKRVRKLVPAWRLPQAVSFKTALRLGAKAPFERVDVGPDELAFLQYTGGTTGCRRARCSVTAISSPTSAGKRHAPSCDRGRARSRHYGVAALSHLRIDRELPDVSEGRRDQRADHESARHCGFRQRACPSPILGHHRREHTLQSTFEQPRFRQTRFLGAAGLGGGRNGCSEDSR